MISLIEPLRDLVGNILGVTCVSIDITERKRAELALRQRQLQLSVLNQMGQALAGTLELAQIYRIAYEHVAQLVDCPCFGISLYDPTTLTLRAEFMLDDGELIEAARFPPLVMDMEPTRGRVRTIATRQPEIIADFPTVTEGADVHLIGAPGDERVVGSAMYVPMIVQGQVMGLLEVQSYQLDAYGAEEAELLGPVANQIGLVIQNARLYKQTQQRLKRLTALHDIDMTITASFDLRVTFDAILDQVTTQLGVDAADVLLLNPHMQTLEYAAGRGFRSHALRHTHLRLGEGYAGQAALERRIVSITNLEEAENGLQRAPLLPQEEFIAYHAVPLIHPRARFRACLKSSIALPLDPAPVVAWNSCKRWQDRQLSL